MQGLSNINQEVLLLAAKAKEGRLQPQEFQVDLNSKISSEEWQVTIMADHNLGWIQINIGYDNVYLYKPYSNTCTGDYIYVVPVNVRLWMLVQKMKEQDVLVLRRVECLKDFLAWPSFVFNVLYTLHNYWIIDNGNWIN